MWFDNAQGIVRVILVGTATYLTLIVVLRLSGKRTLAKLNAFDFVVTVALGSTLATILLSKDVAMAEGVAALALLAGLQLVVAKVTSLVPGTRTAVTARPSFLVLDGRLLEDALRRHRISRTEVNQVVRGTGQGDMSRVSAVVLETDGTLSVITSEQLGDGSALGDVAGGPPRR